MLASEQVRSMAQEEQILVVKREVIERVGMFQGLTFEVDRYLAALFAPGQAFFLPRPAAEKDPSHKQLIPYVLMEHEGKVLSYVRGKRSGETRLVAKRSVGIGGHINPVDEMPLFADFREAYLNAVHREVAEEVVVETEYTERVVALINDDSTEVGSVHLGVVHHWLLKEPNVSRREQVMTQMDFLSLDELQAAKDSMETWSQLCLEYLLAKRSGA
jgi:predicted NUDIX family phosphoesterase